MAAPLPMVSPMPSTPTPAMDRPVSGQTFAELFAGLPVMAIDIGAVPSAGPAPVPLPPSSHGIVPPCPVPLTMPELASSSFVRDEEEMGRQDETVCPAEETLVLPVPIWTLPASLPSIPETTVPAPVGGKNIKENQNIIFDKEIVMTSTFGDVMKVDARTKPAMSPGNAVSVPVGDVIERQIDLTRHDRWTTELARDIAAASTAQDRVAFRLEPARLGRLDVALHHGEAGLSVRIEVETSDAHRLIVAAQPRLMDDLRQQGLRVADAQIDWTMGHGQPHQQFQHQRPQPPSGLTAMPLQMGAQDEATADEMPDGRFA